MNNTTLPPMTTMFRNFTGETPVYFAPAVDDDDAQPTVTLAGPTGAHNLHAEHTGDYNDEHGQRWAAQLPALIVGVYVLTYVSAAGYVTAYTIEVIDNPDAIAAPDAAPDTTPES